MRGVALAQYMGYDFIDLRDWKHTNKIYDAIILIKFSQNFNSDLIGKSKVLIWDALDCFAKHKRNYKPHAYWRKRCHSIKCNAIISTSPACHKYMKETLKRSGVRVFQIPHHADPSIDFSWGNPNGPVVYVGNPAYVSKKTFGVVKNVCKKLGIKVIFDHSFFSQRTLKGASLMLHPRPHKVNHTLNIHCKPQVKIANAAAANLPVIGTRDPCVTSLYDGVVGWNEYDSWETRITNALNRPTLNNPETLESSAAKMSSMLETLLGS